MVSYLPTFTSNCRRAKAPPSSSASRRQFQPVQVTTDRLEAFHKDAHETLSRTINEFIKLDDKPVDPSRWRYMRSDGSLSAYFDRRSMHAQSTSLLIAGTLSARLEDVMEGLYMDNSEDSRMVLHKLCPRFADAEVLQVIEKRSENQPFAFTGLKWALVKSSSSGICTSRDMCFLEKLGTIDLSSGRKLGYFIMQSVELPECPRVPSNKVIRAHVSMCYLFEELQDGTVGIYMRGSMASQSPSILRKLARRSFADLSLSLANAVDVAHAKRYEHLLRTKRRSAVPMSSSVVCDVCECAPTFFGHLQECAGCSRLKVCKRCRVKKSILRRDDASSTRLACATFCLGCVSQVRNATLPPHMSDIGISMQELSEDAGWRTSLSPPMEEDCKHSQRSLRLFSSKLQRQLDNIGFTELDASLRLSSLQSLGAGPLQHDCKADDSEVETDSVHSLDDDSTALSSPQPVEGSESVSDIESIKPVRRSLQPPEMLEAQELDRNGRPRKRPYAKSYSEATALELQRHLLSRLVKASKQTQQLTREQARIAKRRTEGTSNSVC